MGKFKDIKESSHYSEKVDDVVYDILEHGACSTARVQRICQCRLLPAYAIIDDLIAFGYITDHMQAIITRSDFEEILKNRDKLIK